MRTARRVSQLLFFLLFLYLFFEAVYPYEVALPADLFLRASPLAAVASILASRAFVSTVVLGLVILALSIPLGRFFCGWICPLGTVLDATDRWFKRPRRKVGQRESTRLRSWKYALLVAILAGSFLSVQFAGYFDPISVITRAFTAVLLPLLTKVADTFVSLLGRVSFLENITFSAYNRLQEVGFPTQQPLVRGSFLILVLFLVILVLGKWSRRFWCRNLCPLGALLGFVGQHRLTHRTVSTACTDCGVCQLMCRMNAIEDGYRITRTSECIECMQCVDICPEGAISYRLGLPASSSHKGVDLDRRRVLGSLAGGTLAAAALSVGFVGRESSSSKLRPPGALVESEFLDRCVRCLECVRICSSTGACLQPALLERGVAGFWTPVADMRHGYCEYNCNLCGQVCPTGAITRLSVEDKQKVVMGTAYFDRSRCIPWYRNEDCLVCEEHCPIPEKAIRLEQRPVQLPSGETRLVKFPYVVEDLCIGCGICVTKCPVEGQPGIFVTTAREERFTARGEKVRKEEVPAYGR
ncbi:MAG: 4Fe-4S binding protein [candidate division KSB1 bacterium]|nr:4Fe-4S binding protein [candidate division KSB1 bacterium]